MKKAKQLTALLLCGLILLPPTSAAAEPSPSSIPAAEPSVPVDAQAEPLTIPGGKTPVSMDESVYANLDYYGGTQQIKIVKGCSLNGQTSFTDYGAYASVKNMSDDTVPSLSEGKLDWALKDTASRFYYECTPEDGAVVLPWEFQITYLMNGIPVDAETLAGASGLVEIRIQATPVENAAAYYRNNLLLMVAVPVDIEKALSVEAPGAQLQSLGSMSAAVFTAVPGEEKEFVVRIGSQSFELDTGILMMMVPGTVDSLNKITDLKESKETLEDSGDALYNSMNGMLDTVEGMSEGLQSLQSGLDSLQKAQEKTSASKSKLQKEADQSLADLKALSEQTALMVPHMENLRGMGEDLRAQLNAAMDTVKSLRPQLDELGKGLVELNETMTRLRASLSASNRDLKEAHAALDDMGESLSDLTAASQKLSKQTEALTKRLGELKDDMHDLQKRLEQASGALPGGGAGESAVKAAQEALDSLTGAVESMEALSKALNGAASALPSFLSSTNDLLEAADSGISGLRDGINITEDALASLDTLEGTTQGLLQTSQALIDNLSSVQTVLDGHYGEMQNAILDTEALVSRTAEALSNAQTLLSTADGLMKDAGDDLDNGTRAALQGMVSVMQNSLRGIGNVPQTRKAGDTIKETVDGEMDDLEKDSNLLEMDPQAARVSFTSPQNPEPRSLQVILRTEEISVKSTPEERADMETETASASPFERMGMVFTKIWGAAVDAFASL